jgi:thiol-disulfide isomerase/thioredoxin
MMAAGPRAKRPPQSWFDAWFDRSKEGGEPVMARCWSGSDRRKADARLTRLAVLGWVAIVIMLAGLARPEARAAESGPMPDELRGFVAAEPGKPAAAIQVLDQGEQTVGLDAFRGRLVLVNFWATWCEPCVKEMPALDTLQTRFAGRPFSVLAISEDRGGLAVVRKYYDQHALDGLDIYTDAHGEAGRAFAIRGLPTTILIDASGQELGRVEGAVEWDAAAVAAQIEKFIAAGGRPKG